jgi:hypothetical protein
VTDVLKQLQRGSFSDIEFPISHREYGFQQEQAAHRFIFRDNELIESLGRKNPTWRYTIPFREDITVTPWANLFTRVYPFFLAACRERDRQDLVDPIHGKNPVKCVSLREILDVNRRDGIDVEVEFIYAPTMAQVADGEVVGTKIHGVQGFEAGAKRFDGEIKKINWRQEIPPEPTVSPLDAISAVGGQVLLVQGKVAAALGDSAFRLEKAVQTIDRLRDPNLASTRTQARRLQGAALDLEDRVDITGAQPLRKLVTASNITVAALAGKLGITLELLLKWNPALRRSPLVKANTEIRVTAEVLAKASR